MAAPAFLTCFPVYCPHIPAPVSEKQEDTAARHKENPHILTQAEFPFSNPIQWHN